MMTTPRGEESGPGASAPEQPVAAVRSELTTIKIVCRARAPQHWLDRCLTTPTATKGSSGVYNNLHKTADNFDRVHDLQWSDATNAALSPATSINIKKTMTESEVCELWLHTVAAYCGKKAEDHGDYSLRSEGSLRA